MCHASGSAVSHLVCVLVRRAIRPVWEGNARFVGRGGVAAPAPALPLVRDSRTVRVSAPELNDLHEHCMDNAHGGENAYVFL